MKTDNTITAIPLRQVKFRLILLGVLFVGIYARAFSHLFEAWQKSDFSHGALIPFISLYFVWLNRLQIRYISIRPNFIIGIPLIFIASLVLILGNRGGVIIVEELSMIIMLFGSIMLLLGTGYAKVLAFPVVYLVFMIPILDPIVNHDVFWHFQLVTATIASYLLFLFKVPVLHIQQYLELPNMTLEVAQGCSGIKFLLSLIALTIPLAQLTLRTRTRKVILLLLAIPIAIVTNGLRVALIGVWVYHFNKTEHIHGPVHTLQGWFVSTLGMILLFICATLLQRGLSSRPGIINKPSHHMPNIASHIIDIKKFNIALIVTILLGIFIGYAIYLYTPQPVHLKRNLQTLPLNIDHWKGEDSAIINEAMLRYGVDSELNRSYKDPSTGRTIGLYIGYFASQTQGKELINVTLNDLYMKTSQYVLKSDNIGESHTINRAVMTNGGKNLLVLYWYDINGHIIANRYEAKLLTAVNGAIRNTTNGAIIMITSEFNGSSEVNELTRTDESFIMELQPLLSTHLSHQEL